MNTDMKKQTAMAQHIESMQRFIEEHSVKDIDKYPGAMAITILQYAIEDAKLKLALEKEQIADAYENIENHNGFDSYPTGEAYYNETYGGDK